MSRAIHVFRSPDRFVAGTIGQPGDRTFYLQAVHEARIISVMLEKQQVQILADRIGALLDEYRDDERKDVAEDSVDDAVAALAMWRDAHAAMLERTNAGDFNGATAIAVGDHAR